MEVRLCECGCGQPAPIAKNTDTRNGWLKGQPKRFRVGHSSKKKPNEVIHFNNGVTVIILEYKGTVLFCFINTARYPEVRAYRWYASKKPHHKTFYAGTNIKRDGKWHRASLHQLLTGFQFEEVDHKDGNGLNNLDNNLRDAQGRNSQNKGGYTNNTSGVTGVKRSQGKWVAAIGAGGKRQHLGTFNNLSDAVVVRRAAEIQYHGDFRRRAT